MAGHGGARNRSGPTSSPYSNRTDLKKSKGLLGAIKLPPEGFQGEDFPPLFDLLPAATEREGVVWSDAWATPQAAQWISEPWRWRTIAMWVRYTVRMEDPESPAALGAVTTRFADQIGLTPAGLRENGWVIEASEPASAAKTPAKSAGKPVRRLRSVANGDD